jgi:hypothetical protein
MTMVFLNTGVSFPIAFDHARIHGAETKLEIPRPRSNSTGSAFSTA